MVFNAVFTSNIILSYLFFIFLIINLYFLIPAVIAQSFVAAAELVILVGISTKEAKAEMETHPVTAEAKIGKCSV